MDEITQRWIDQSRPRYLRLTVAVVELLQKLLAAATIEYISVTGRTKEPDRIREKINRKAYYDPARQVTDLSGIRVIGFLEVDVAKICTLIRQSFFVDESNSLDKSAALGTDK